MKFIKPLLPKREAGKTLRALDVGAGIGRITGALLLELCDTVPSLGSNRRDPSLVPSAGVTRSTASRTDAGRPARGREELRREGEGRARVGGRAGRAVHLSGDAGLGRRTGQV